MANLTACPDLGKPPLIASCKLTVNGVWKSVRLGFELAPQVRCPIPLRYNGEHKGYAATITGPSNQLRGDLATIVYADDKYSVRGGQGTYFVDFGYNYSSAYLSFEYAAGYPATPVAYRSDFAETYVPLNYGASGTAEVELNYRTVVNASASGPTMPAQGTVATWSVNATNAPEPYAYRWFKNDVELVGEISSSIQLPITADFFTLKLIVSAADGTADTALVHVTPNWHVTIWGMNPVRPMTSCGFVASVDNGGAYPFTYQWILDGILQEETNGSIFPELSAGTHTLEGMVTDATGFVTKGSLQIDVRADAPANCM